MVHAAARKELQAREHAGLQKQLLPAQCQLSVHIHLLKVNDSELVRALRPIPIIET
jgi:hypothetical protein